MSRYLSTAEFIKLCCKDDNRLRYDALHKSIGLDKRISRRYQKEIDQLLDFVKEIDTSHHRYENTDPLTETTVFGKIFHTYVASDLRAMIILAVTGQHNQSNMVLRHLIENIVYSFWADLISKFSYVTEYLLYPDEWKPYRSLQKIIWNPDEKNYPQRSICERLERIRLINFKRKQGKEFYKEYFRTANMCDIINLISLPICSSCMDKAKSKDPTKPPNINYIKSHTPMRLRKQGIEEKHAYYKTDFGYYCSFCKRQKLTEGFALGIPGFDDMIEMLVEAIIDDDKISERLRTLSLVYSHLSSVFIHFSTDVLPDTKPDPYNTTSGKVVLWGFGGIIFFIIIIKPIIDFYFKELRKQVRRLKRLKR